MTSMAVAVVGMAPIMIIKAAALFSPPEVEVEVEVGERAMTTSLMVILLGPSPVAMVIVITIDGAAICWTGLSPPMTTVTIILIVVTTIVIDGVAISQTDQSPPCLSLR